MRRPRFERGSSITVFPGFFQMVGKEPFFSLLTAPSTWTDLSKGIWRKMVRTNSEATVWVEMCMMGANESFPFSVKSLVDRRLMDGNSGRYISNIIASLHNTTPGRHTFTRNTQMKAGEQFFRILFPLSHRTRAATLSRHTKLATFV